MKRPPKQTNRDRQIERLVEEARRVRSDVPRDLPGIRAMLDPDLMAAILVQKVAPGIGDVDAVAAVAAVTKRGEAAAMIERYRPSLVRGQAIAIVARVLPDLSDVDLAASAHALTTVANDTKQTPIVVAGLLLAAWKGGASGLTPSPNLARLLQALAADPEW